MFQVVSGHANPASLFCIAAVSIQSLFSFFFIFRIRFCVHVSVCNVCMFIMFARACVVCWPSPPFIDLFVFADALCYVLMSGSISNGQDPSVIASYNRGICAHANHYYLHSDNASPFTRIEQVGAKISAPLALPECIAFCRRRRCTCSPNHDMCIIYMCMYVLYLYVGVTWSAICTATPFGPRVFTTTHIDSST